MTCGVEVKFVVKVEVGVGDELSAGLGLCKFGTTVLCRVSIKVDDCAEGDVVVVVDGIIVLR